MHILRAGLAAGIVALCCGQAAADALRIGGTGAVTAMLQQVGAAFSADTEIKVEVIPALGSSGSIQAVRAGVLDIAISGRQLKPDELAQGLTSVPFVRTPFGFVTSHRNPDGITRADLPEIFKSEKAGWKDGTPVRIILRPRSESDTALIGDLFPGMGPAIEAARRRPDVPMAATDQDNADMAERTPGSLVGATFTQIKLEKRRLRFVPIDGVEPSLESLENGTYPYEKTMYLVLPSKPSSAAERFLAHLRSPKGRDALRDTGTLLVSN